MESIENENLLTEVTKEDINNGIEDEFGVVYSADGKRLLKCKSEKLMSYVIKEGTQVICNSAFDDCVSLQQITIPDSVTSIGDFAFECCDSLRQINIPDSVTYISDEAFAWCESLQQIIISKGTTEKFKKMLDVDFWNKLIENQQ